MKRVTDPADPRRCKHSFPHEQCWNESEEGSANCSAHGGRSTADQDSKRQYLLAQVEDRRRLAEFAQHDHIKSLRDEIGLVRLLIEKRFNLIRTESDLLQGTASLNAMFLTLERLVKSCHNLEQSLGELLSKDSVVRLGQAICEIVIDELQGVEGHEEIIDRIVGRLFPTISNARNQELTKIAA